MPVTRLLIANRGEIAVRVIRTCRRLGITTIAVYSSVDCRALHVLEADEAYEIGPAPALQSYLNIDAVIDAARRGRADSVHPGYGFLAENETFARAVLDAGMTWVGPPPHVIRLLGDKVRAKELADVAGVPTVPGYRGDDQTAERLAREAESMGYPVMIKAAAGGGGKGMRAVASPDELEPSLGAAHREAAAAFGDDRVFLEKLIERPRHIEIQVFLDTYGNGMYLGERECSVQRRHQKVLEEAPSPVVTPELRRSMGSDAVRLARSAGYVNAGTVEFLYTGQAYYFLEVNTRIQVEHPVTEMVTGQDLIEWQIRVARGEPLPMEQDQLTLQGHAVEVRLYAEDPATGFLPAAGPIKVFDIPMERHVRVEPGVYPGFDVTTYYDPMLAKIIAHGPTREAALSRLGETLSAADVEGPITNLSFLRWLVAQPDVQAGSADIEYLDRTWSPSLSDSSAPWEVLAAFALYCSLALSGGEKHGFDGSDPWNSTTGWRLNRAPRQFQVGSNGHYEAVTVEIDEDRFSAWGSGNTMGGRILYAGPDRLTLGIGPGIERFRVERDEGSAVFRHGDVPYRLDLQPPPGSGAPSRGGLAEGDPVAPMTGTVVRVEVNVGDRVAAHQPVAVLEAMKMEHAVEAARDGTVSEVLVKAGDMVQGGAALVRLEPSP